MIKTENIEDSYQLSDDLIVYMMIIFVFIRKPYCLIDMVGTKQGDQTVICE